MSMFEKFAGVAKKFEELESQLASGTLSSKELTEVSKERASLEDIVIAYKKSVKIQEDIANAKAMLADSDPDMVSLAKQELAELEPELERVKQELILLSLPTDPNDVKDVILEIRAGTGGEESTLFAADLLRMYTRYAEKQKWRVEIMNSTSSAAGEGFKEVIILIKGQAVFSRLKFESGVHRVQRVPATESQGRIHTSACTVAILPEADDIDVTINPKDLDIVVCRASGAGGQHVNTTDSAVRIVHKPTGLAVECQDERSQHKNKDKAMKVLKARLFERAQREQQDQISADRRGQIGSGDRSERIRTYNFPQGRLTDHRINLTLYKLDDVMQGDLTEVLDALGTNHQAELLKSSGNDYS